MNSRWFVRVLLMTCWVPVVFAVAAVCWKSLEITGRPTEYVARGKLVVSSPPASQNGEPDPNLGASGEILESGEIKRRALERVRGLHPELKEVEVEIRAMRAKGSSIIQLAAIAEEQKYARVFLDALMDEFMAFEQEILEKSMGNGINKIVEEVLAREKRTKAYASELDAFEKNNDELLLTTEHERLVKSVSSQRGEVESFERMAGADDKLKAAREALAQAEGKLKEVSQKQLALAELRQKYAVELADYQTWKKNLDGLENHLKITTERVAIIERPSVAVAELPPWNRAIGLAALTGAGAGLVLIFLVSTLVGFACRPAP